MLYNNLSPIEDHTHGGGYPTALVSYPTFCYHFGRKIYMKGGIISMGTFVDDFDETYEEWDSKHWHLQYVSSGQYENGLLGRGFVYGGWQNLNLNTKDNKLKIYIRYRAEEDVDIEDNKTNFSDKALYKVLTSVDFLDMLWQDPDDALKGLDSWYENVLLKATNDEELKQLHEKYFKKPTQPDSNTEEDTTVQGRGR